jgi:hypothetical protein
MFENYKFIDAYFTNNEKTVITSLWEDKDGETIEAAIPAEDDNPLWKELLNVPDVTIDSLHERTYKYIREQRAIFEEQIITIGKREGLVYDVDNINTDIYKAIAHCVFDDFNEEDDKEKLFMYKISLFETDLIKNCKDKKLKTALRRTKNIVEATKAAIAIVESMADTTE